MTTTSLGDELQQDNRETREYTIGGKGHKGHRGQKGGSLVIGQSPPVFSPPGWLLTDNGILGKISAAGVSASESGLYFTVWYLEAGSVMRPAVI